MDVLPERVIVGDTVPDSHVFKGVLGKFKLLGFDQVAGSFIQKPECDQGHNLHSKRDNEHSHGVFVDKLYPERHDQVDHTDYQLLNGRPVGKVFALTGLVQIGSGHGVPNATGGAPDEHASNQNLIGRRNQYGKRA